jgi:site-specific DNA-methyltransferase (adenine-specific)
MTESQILEHAIVRYEPAFPLADLAPNPRNYRRHPPEQRALLEAILDSGDEDQIGALFVQPLTSNLRTGFLVDGHLRREVLLARGFATAPVDFIDVSEDVEAMLLLTLDPLAGMADQDAALKAALAQGVDTAGKADALVAYLRRQIPPEHDPAVAGAPLPELPTDPVTKPGDTWLLGDHRLRCGDCRDVADVDYLFADLGCVLAVTSPPYADRRDYDATTGFRGIPPEEYAEWFWMVQHLLQGKLDPDGSFFLNIKAHAEDGQRSLYVMDLVIAMVRQWGWRFVDDFCWRNTANGVPGGWTNRFKNAHEPVYHFCRQQKIVFRPDHVGYESEGTFKYHPRNSRSRTGTKFTGSGWRAEAADGKLARPSNVIEAAAETNQPGHTAPFPLALPDFFVRAYSDPGDHVYEPFAGSGTTLIACERNERRCFAMELSPAYCDVIVERWQHETGGQARREGQ